MKSLENFIIEQEFINELSIIFEDIDKDDKQYFSLIETTNDYNIYLDNHVYSRLNLHTQETGNIGDKISISSIKSAVKRAYKSIDSLFSGNRLTANKSGKNAFLIKDEKHFEKLNIIGWVYKLNNDGKYDICIKTVMSKDNFKISDKDNKQTIAIKLKESQKDINIWMITLK